METVKDQRRNKEDNLVLWQKGQSGNPKGRPPNEYSLTIAAQEYLKANPEERSAIVKRVADDAKKGIPYAAKLFWSYMDGQPPQTIDHLSGGEKVINENAIVQAILTALGK